MDMEHLNKSQIVLLTLLVSFFTSIATGIVTVSLMDQAPPIVAQTVSRVIEKTVETVVPAPAGQTAGAATTIVTKEKTVVVTESEQIAKAIERVSPSLVRVYTTAEDEPLFLGIGIVLDSSGTIITDIAAIDQRSEASLVLPDSTRVRAFVTKRDASIGIAYLKMSTSSESQTPKITWKPVSIATNRPVLGASAVALSGKTVARIANGLVTALLGDKGTVIDTDIPETSIMQGSPLVDTSGNLIGVSTGVARASSAQGFITAAELLPPAAGKASP